MIYYWKKNIDLLLVISDTIVEYCMELVNSYSIPIIQIVEETIDYVNEQFEYKNLAFMACNNMIEANIYQKNFRYNHLYTLVADDMDKLLYEGKTKTSESFAQTRACLLATAKKDIDVIIPSKIHFLLLKTEIYEFLKNVIVVPIDEVLTTKVIESLYKKNPLPQKGKGKVIIHINKSISDKVLSKYLNIKYKIILEEGGKEYGKK